jgi:hydroxyacylglutathione hydrolase
MYIQQIYTKCLSESTYYIESNGEAAIIDPLRDINPYHRLAETRNCKIKYIFETHFHADFVSGHIDLAKTTGAQIIFGPSAKAKYEITIAKDYQDFKLGEITIKVLHTPGHTMESSCFLVIDKNGKEYAVFTGDTLFIGDVGRPDLAVTSNLSKEDLARYLYHSINEKLIVLDDSTIVYPAHGAGSQCGKNMSNELFSTIGNQKKFNYALKLKTEESFIKTVLEGLTNPPQYFPKNARINKEGYQPIEDILKKADNPLNANSFKKKMNEEDIVILDTRQASIFSAGFIPGSINIGLEGSFAVWIGTLFENPDTNFLLVTEKGKEEETVIRLSRVGYENVGGYLKGGFDAWKSSGESSLKISNCCPVLLRMENSDKNIIDVRTVKEYSEGHIDAAENISLKTLEKSCKTLNKTSKYYVYCKSGYRSMIATSMLMAQGFQQVINVKKGYEGYNNKCDTCCSIKLNNHKSNQ